MNRSSVFQSKTEAIFALNLIVIVEAFIIHGFNPCNPCQPCQPCSRTSAQMNSQLTTKAATKRVAVITDESYIRYIFERAFPDDLFPIYDPYDPRVIAIAKAVRNMKNG